MILDHIITSYCLDFEVSHLILWFQWSAWNFEDWTLKTTNIAHKTEVTRGVKIIPQSILQKMTGFNSSNSLYLVENKCSCHHKKVHPQAADKGDCTKIRGTSITYLISMVDSPQWWSSSLAVWASYGMSTSWNLACCATWISMNMH
jgi:hypothetical protein